MKTSTIPSLRVNPQFRHEAESVLADGEFLSAFVEEALRQQTQRRKKQKEFIARGLASSKKAKSTGLYASKDEMMGSLRSILEEQRSKE